MEPIEAPAPQRRGTRTLGFDLTALALIGVLLFGALGVATLTIYDRLYSPAAFVTRYLELLSQGRAADALALPGVRIDSTVLDEADLPVSSNEALLRRDALAPLTDIAVVETVDAGDLTRVTVSYEAGGNPGRTTFDIVSNGWVGVVPTWRFARSPLAVIEMTVRGAMQYSVNGFEIDKRQVSPDGVSADPLAPVPMLVFSPGLYSLSVDTPSAASEGVAVLSDLPQKLIPIAIQAQPTEKFTETVQEKVDGFLASCAQQKVLQPSGCPFGLMVRNRVAELPEWTITKKPHVTLEPDGANWRIREAEGTAHVNVAIRYISDGTVREWDEDIEFTIGGTVTMLPDGTAAISVAGED